MLVVTRRLVALSAAALMIIAALGACTQPSPEPSRSTAPTVKHTPAFASDADALKAATDAYAAYLKMSDTIAHDGGANPERIKPYVTGSWLPRELEGFSKLKSSGRHQTGWTKFSHVKLQLWHEAAKQAEIEIYACSDSSATEIVDGAGHIVTPTDRQTLVASVATFVSPTSAQEVRLRLKDYEPWPGQEFC
jgi:hypothetical protein